MVTKKTTNKAKEVLIYSTPTCHFCHMAKDFFNENKISYKEFDVASDVDRRKEMMEKSGQLGVPVIVIDGDWMVGYDEEKLKELLGVH